MNTYAGFRVTSWATIRGATLNVHGGHFDSYLAFDWSSSGTINSGTVYDTLAVRDDASVEINGGTFNGRNTPGWPPAFLSGERTRTVVRGGQFNGDFFLYGNGEPELFIYGDNLRVGGHTVYGLADADQLVTTGAMSRTVTTNLNGIVILNYEGALTGILDDGSVLDTILSFRSLSDGNHARVYLVPEPSMIMLVACGGVALLIRNRRR